MSDVRRPDYGSEIRKLRLGRGWARERLAEESGLTVADVDEAERGDFDNVAAILTALEAEPLTLVLPQSMADYLRTVRPIADRVPAEQLPIALAECLGILARAAAGVEASATVRQYNVVTGGEVDIDQVVH
jgi:transcriptional regulator with XRE-family HTH domain